MRFYTRLLLIAVLAIPLSARSQKTSLLSDAQINAIVAEASGTLAKANIAALGRFHRVQASAGFHEAASFMALKAREYGLQEVKIDSFLADGVTTYNTFRSYLGWEADSGILTEVAPRKEIIAEYPKLRVALADYSNDANITTELIDVGAGTSEKNYTGKEVKGKIVLAGGGLMSVHRQAVDLRGAAGILSYQQNQTTGWSGDYADNVRWGHLSPYNLKNTFAFMISLHQAREYQSRLARGEKIRLHAAVKARMKAGYFEVVSAIIPGTDPAAGEIVFTCHLCHQLPGANDNASGAVSILEDARLLVALIQQGKLPQPRRTIRFIWPPEIAGTMCYFSRYPEIVKRMRAAIHKDMVGGSHQITKAIFHLTQTPTSLPSFVNDVAAVFGEYVIEGSHRAAKFGDFSEAIFSPDGSKEMLVANFHPFTMGSDHDVYQEGSFRIPTIYMNDWPDVFIHTNNDSPDNIDATKLRRVSVIGASAGYFLASAGANEAKTLAGEVFARGSIRQGRALQRALVQAHGSFTEAQNIVAQTARWEREALFSISTLTPNDQGLRALLDNLTNGVNAREAEAIAMLRTFSPESSSASSPDTFVTIVPQRHSKVIGNLEVYYYDYIDDHLKDESPGDLARLTSLPNGGTLAYETLNLVDGKRNVRQIRNVLSAAYGMVPTDAVLDYLKLLEKIGVVTLEKAAL
jgi:Zn-dependent M28 family amino/carboxypeptidase